MEYCILKEVVADWNPQQDHSTVQHYVAGPTCNLSFCFTVVSTSLIMTGIMSLILMYDGKLMSCKRD